MARRRRNTFGSYKTGHRRAMRPEHDVKSPGSNGGSQSMKDESYGHQVRVGSTSVVEAGPCIGHDLGLEHGVELLAQAADLDRQR
jgi:hypothetical protein